MSDRTNPYLPKIYIARTGDKFPPFKYDATATPDTLESATTKRNGQVERVRRVLQPTMVRRQISPHRLLPPVLLLVLVSSHIFRELISTSLPQIRNEVSSCRRPTRCRPADPCALQVSVELQLNSIYNLVEKGQSFQSDFILISTWFDSRLVNPKAKEVTVYGTDVFNKDLLWSPKLTFANRRDLTNSIEGVVRVTRAGQVTVVHIYFICFHSSHFIRVAACKYVKFSVE